MSKLFSILKINILSLLSFPLLLVSIASKLLLKALEKAMVFLGVGAALLGLALLKLFLNNPWGLFEGLGLIVVCLVFLGFIGVSIFVVVVLCGSLLAAVFSIILSAVSSVLSFIFEVGHEGYAKLHDVCKVEYDKLKEGQTRYLAWKCPLWSLLRGFNLGVVILFSSARPISVVASIGLVAGSFFIVQNAVSRTFGISVFAYLKLFPAMEMVFTVLYFVVLVAASVIVILSLGIEWGEWGQMLKLSTQNYQEYRKAMFHKNFEANTVALADGAFEEGKNQQRCQQYLDMLNEMYGDFESLQQQVDTAMHIRHDTSVIYDLSEYTSLLEEISKKLSEHGAQISSDLFEKQFIPLIDKAQHLSKAITKSTLHIINQASASLEKSRTTFNFFEGCISEEDIKKRYKALCKVYHPDVGGHEETFKIMKDQYENLSKDFSLG